MGKTTMRFALAWLLSALASPASAAMASNVLYKLASPNGQVQISVAFPADADASWRVSYRGRPMLAPAAIGLRFAGEPTAPRLVEAGVRRSTHDERVTGLVGKASSARDHYTQAVIALAERDGSKRRFELVLRAYDDGVAYRWRIVDAGGPFALAAEVADFGVARDATVWALPVQGFVSSYESFYLHGALAKAVPRTQLVALPMLFRRGDGAWGAITEAVLTDWAGLYLRRGDGDGLRGTLSPLPSEPGIVVRGGRASHEAPWRVVLLGDQAGRLVESNVVALLNPPPDARDWSWVHPGKTSFPWWNDYAWPGASFSPGLNTATMQAYIDFCADHGIPYHTLDGFQDKAWYGGPIGPDGTPQDVTHATPAIDMPAVLAYAKRRGVRLRVWTHWQPLHAQLDEALAAWERWGIEGIMVDFMDRDDQEMVRWLGEVTRKAADHHLTVVFHGTYKPTGEGRTWPNLLTREAVRGMEYNKFSPLPPSTPAHEATVPFTRMLAGPLDYHEGGFDHVAERDFATRNTRPQVIGTRARALALYVVFDDPLSMVADTPVNYRDAAGWSFVAAVPTVWDETRVLAGEPGRYAVIARRRGDAWWIGAITDGHARTVRVRLPASRGSRYRAETFADRAGAPSVPLQARSIVRGDGSLEIAMVAAGGFAATLTPLDGDRAQAAARRRTIVSRDALHGRIPPSAGSALAIGSERR